MQKVKLSRTYTPDSTGRALYAGSEYDLDAGVAEEVVGMGAGDYVAPEGVEATDAATREAAKAGVDLTKVKATGSGGKVTVEDVREKK
jgi:pyruvate/2-oxoglutarate dehydrogenase complex dihydrolipoamide acyltransferase (E2) component